MSLPGLPNLHRVTTNLYRGAQPAPKGLLELKRLGIRTVVSLREHNDDEAELKKAGLTTADLRLVSIPIDTAKLNQIQMIDFLKIVTDPTAQPVFVHCLHGADRTGTAIATYRLAVEGWTKKDAIDELRQGGYGFHEMWKNLPEFIEGLDVAGLRAKVGIQATAPTP
jgi:protein tyrosine/serine phosphatase